MKKSKIKEVTLWCQAMSQETLSQVENSLPESANMFKGLSLLNLKKILSLTPSEKFEDLPYPHRMESNSVVEAQYREVYMVEWCEEEFFAEIENADSLK